MSDEESAYRLHINAVIRYYGSALEAYSQSRWFDAMKAFSMASDGMREAHVELSKPENGLIPCAVMAYQLEKQYSMLSRYAGGLCNEQLDYKERSQIKKEMNIAIDKLYALQERLLDILKAKETARKNGWEWE